MRSEASRVVLAQRPSTRSFSTENTARFGYRGQRFKRSLRGRCNHHFGPLCVEPHAPDPASNTGTGRRVSKRITLRNIREWCRLQRSAAVRPTSEDGQRREPSSRIRSSVSRGRPNACRQFLFLICCTGSRPFASQAGRRLADRPRRTGKRLPAKRRVWGSTPAGAGDYQPRRRYGYGDRRFRPQSAGTGKETLRRDRTQSQYIIKTDKGTMEPTGPNFQLHPRHRRRSEEDFVPAGPFRAAWTRWSCSRSSCEAAIASAWPAISSLRGAWRAKRTRNSYAARRRRYVPWRRNKRFDTKGEDGAL